MTRTILSALLLATALAAPAASQAPPHALVFVMNDDGTTADFGSIDGQPSALGDLYDTTLVRLVPAAGGPARKLTGLAEWACLLGDEDGDGDLWEGLFDDLDAVGLNAWFPPPERLRSRDLILSCEDAFGGAQETFAYDSIGACDGSLFRLERTPDGQSFQVRTFLAEWMVLQAIGQFDFTDGVDVDAFAMDGEGNIYLSFRVDELVNGVVLEDDGVVALPGNRLDWSTQLDVVSADPGSAVRVLDALAVNALVLHAGLKNASGLTITSLTDLQALELDPSGGSFAPVQASQDLPAVPHLLFNGQTLGPTVLTTRDGGRIATLDGAALGSLSLSGGPLGLDPASTSGATSDLNALLVLPDTLPVPMLDVTDGEVDVHATGSAEIELLGAHFTPAAPALLLVDGRMALGGDTFPSLPLPAALVYPDWYLGTFPVLLAVVADGAGRFRQALTAPAVPVSYVVLAQAADLVRKEVSSPALVSCP